MADGTRPLDGTKMVDKMLRRLQVAGPDWKSGVQNPRRDPIAAGIAAKAKWAGNVQKAITEDRFSKGLAKVDKSAMAATIAATPDSAVYDGVARREGKLRTRFTRLASLISSAQSQVQSMAQGTEQERVQRMLKNLELMKAVKAGMQA
jgi:hypothetical protein